MTIIKKTVILVILIILFLIPVWAKAESGNYTFSLSPILGIQYGHADEIVYKYSGKDQYLSHLFWELKPLVYTGIEAEFGPRKNGFITALSLKYGLPFKTGIMENRDWDDSRNENLTHYSVHDSYSQSAFLADLSVGYSWSPKESLAIGLYGEFSYLFFSWSAKYGYSQYAKQISPRQYEPWDESLPKIPFSGSVINYYQNWFIFSPGLSLNLKLNRNFLLEGYFNYSPLIFCIARDDHLLRKITFHDNTSFGHHLRGGASLFFLPENDNCFFISLSYQYISGSRGDTREEEGNMVSYNYGSAGAGYAAFDLGLGVKMRIYGRQ